MRTWRRYEFYEDRPSGSLERITLTDEHAVEAYLVVRERGRWFGLRRLSLQDREQHERAWLRLKPFGPLSYELVRDSQLQATIARERLSARDRFKATSVAGGQLVATAPLGSGEYNFGQPPGQIHADADRRRSSGHPPHQRAIDM